MNLWLYVKIVVIDLKIRSTAEENRILRSPTSPGFVWNLDVLNADNLALARLEHIRKGVTGFQRWSSRRRGELGFRAAALL